ncbi:S41 family peptidase [Flavobacterium sp. MFBS3-15]|uniref:S41 family peptidase n=1 Tax=Flavobacterium sp. MFBS3-15 TaxID=2989816 RepID=UPI0022368734|nr:carboxy terminal-processing peptidase [Flavobacterium sp. MFBS3-15]MCW4469908.1 S41 family peptidase [Flavobacterium sp. MFBS3-15]
MKKLFAFALLLPLAMGAQNHDKACDVFSKVNSVLQSRHYKPKPVDDSLSVYVFDKVMEGLDDNRILFLKEEYEQLARHRYAIDNYIKDKDCSFFSDFITIYKKALERSRGFVEEIGREPLPFNTKDTIYYSRETFPFHSKADRIKSFLRKKITYDILEDISEQSKNKDSLKVHLEALGKISRPKILESYLCKANLLLNPSEGFENSIYNRFYSVFCSYFDPHSTYFNYSEKASFVSSISTENYSLGLYVSQNEKEQIIVEDIVPGGPAYKTDKIKKGDEIIKLAANDTEYTVSCASMDKINDIVNSDTYRTVVLTLRKKDGSVYSVSLEKKVMKADDHSVYSFVLGDKDPVGYIKVPSFYTAFDSDKSQGCADDVAREVVKLKKENIKGLIIDLQYNGGGSMDEVIRMAGMFINFGPVAVVTDKDMDYNVIKDFNRGMVFNGPMVVLVNGFSASASEFFAGVMQDYNRAIIVGNTTVGKATMQTILPLEAANEKPEDFVKVTIDKFYRITGKSSQYIGIVPDVELPTFFDKLLPRERTMTTAIKNDSIADLHLRFSKMPEEPIKRAAELSRNRTASDAGFQMVTSVNDRINALYNNAKKPVAVTFDSVFDDVHSMDQIWKDISAAAEKELGFSIRNTAFNQEVTGYDDYLKNANEYKIKSVKTDMYINEAVNILKDLNQ